MKNKAFLSFLLLVALSLACNAPAGTSQPSEVESVQGTNTSLPEPSKTPVPSATPKPTLLPPDITFSIDCSAVDASLQPDCDTYIANTRDKVYPLLRELTGVSLSSCYTNINYTILPDDPAPGAGGTSSGPEIRFNREYSIDLPHQQDVHELIHSISSCSGALDGHIFHGMLQNTVFKSLRIVDPGYFVQRANPVELNEYLYEKIKTSSGDELIDQCRGILGNHATIVYFEVPTEAITILYRSTINPQPVNAPNEKLKFMWGESAALQVQVLLEKLEADYKYVIDVPECGY